MIGLLLIWGFAVRHCEAHGTAWCVGMGCGNLASCVIARLLRRIPLTPLCNAPRNDERRHKGGTAVWDGQNEFL